MEQQRRSAVLTDLADKLRSDFAASLVGSRETVLLESATHGTCGRYLDVRLDRPVKAGTLVPVRIERTEGDVCFGVIIAIEDCANNHKSGGALALR
jgi:tRNA A37 methylthiotransferase MiaB